MEADAHRVGLDFRREIHRGLLDRTGELASLEFLSRFHGWLLGVLVVVQSCGLFSAAWWTGAMHSRVQEYDLRLVRIEDDSAKRHEAVGLRLRELESAIRRANDRPTSAR